MKKLIIALFLSGSCWFNLACNSNSGAKQEDSTEVAEDANEQKENLDDDASEFAVKAASGSMLEVELGQLAQQRAQSQQVKDFGAMMVRDHSKASDELKTLAAAQSITLPASMSDEHRKHVEELSQKSGAEFDRDYIKLMVEDHQEDIDLFKKAADEADNAAIKAFAGKTLPTLQQHLKEAQAIHDRQK